jgi:hypothetical protein
MESIEETFGRNLLYQWLQFVVLEMINDTEKFPVDALNYLVDLYQPSSLKLYVSTERSVSGNNKVAIKYTENSKDDHSVGTVEITFTANKQMSSSFHLNSILQYMYSTSCLPPRIEIGPDTDDGNMSAYGDEKNASALTGFDYFVVHPNVASACRTLETMDAVVDIVCAKQLLDFATGLEHFPNIKRRGSSLQLKLSMPQDNDDSPLMWKKAFYALGRVESLDYVHLSFASASTPFPEEGIQVWLETTESLDILNISNYCWRSLDQVARALKHNTSITELCVDGKPDGENYDKQLFEEVLCYQNFTLTLVEVDPDIDCQHYCDMNAAGRKRLLNPEATKRDAVEVFQKAINNTDTLFGLLRIRPDLWAR